MESGQRVDQEAFRPRDHLLVVRPMEGERGTVQPLFGRCDSTYKNAVKSVLIVRPHVLGRYAMKGLKANSGRILSTILDKEMHLLRQGLQIQR